MEIPNFFKTRVGIITLHVLGWIIYFLRDIIDYFVEPFDFELTCLSISFYFLIVSTFYLFYNWVWPKFLKPGKYYRIIPGIIGGLAYFIGGRYLIQEVIFPATLGFGNYYIELDFFFYVDDNWWRAFQIIVYSAVIYLLVDKVNADKKRSSTEKAKSEAELSFLRSQINPHFLFNMLNYLHTEAYMKDEKLANSILQLSDLLRYSTQKSNHLGATLEDEIYHLKNYIELYKKRFGENCYLNYSQAGKPDGQRVEPLLFIPFVENAFKHGVYTDKNVPIVVDININGQKIDFRCSNKVNQQNKDKGSGVGLQNVKQRLELIYPEKHQLNINKTNDTFTVDLSIQLK